MYILHIVATLNIAATVRARRMFSSSVRKNNISRVSVDIAFPLDSFAHFWKLIAHFIPPPKVPVGTPASLLEGV